MKSPSEAIIKHDLGEEAYRRFKRRELRELIIAKVIAGIVTIIVVSILGKAGVI